MTDLQTLTSFSQWLQLAGLDSSTLDKVAEDLVAKIDELRAQEKGAFEEVAARALTGPYLRLYNILETAAATNAAAAAANKPLAAHSAKGEHVEEDVVDTGDASVIKADGVGNDVTGSVAEDVANKEDGQEPPNTVSPAGTLSVAVLFPVLADALTPGPPL